MFSRPFAVPAMLVALVMPAHGQEPAGGSAVGAISDPIMQVLPNADEISPTEVKEFASGQLGGSFTARDIIDRTLYHTSGGEIGTIVDLGVDKNDRVSLVVVEVSNGDGQGRRIAFDFEHLTYQAADGLVRLVANIRQEDIDSAPSFNSLADAAALRQSGSEAPADPPAPGQ